MRILFISHDATRTGAPIMLLNFAKILSEKGFEMDFVLRYEGDIEADFRKIGKVTVMSRTKRAYVARIKNQVGNKIKKIILKLRSGKYDLILSNTITNGSLYQYLSQKVPVITYVHELPYSIFGMSNKADVKKVISRTKIFLSASEAVDINLKEMFNVLPDSIVRLPYYIPDHFDKKASARSEMRKEIGVSDDDFIVGTIGIMGWRKGTDIFVLVAKKIAESGKQVKFILCGGKEDDPGWRAAKIDIEKLGLQDHVKLISTTKSWMLISCFDLFFLSSREDPYPLVVLEAAMMEMPIVCFKDSGGSPEFIEDNAGITVPYLDIDEAANAIIKLKENQELYKNLSINARKKYLKYHSKQNVLDHFTGILTEL